MAARARRRGTGPVRQLALPGDVPPRIWNVATVRFPEVTQADPAELELDKVRRRSKILAS